MNISDTLLERLANAKLVVAFSGAGMSAESGVATFRDKDGLWSKFKPEELASIDAFLANPQRVWDWYQARRDVVLHARPNAGHHAIAELEQLVPKVSVITQNIDGLHAEAGSTEVIELHGNLRRNYCHSCGKHYDDEELLVAQQIPRCDCGGTIRPDIVWFGEMLPADAMRLADQRAQRANVMFSIGTSGIVYPAAGIPMIGLRSGAYMVEINPEETPLSPYAHETIRTNSGEAMPEILRLLKQRME
jgi:NAD-dependent deacetylase